MGFLVHYNFRPEVDTDVISGVVADYGHVDVRAKFSDSRSNVFDIFEELIACLTNEHDKTVPIV